MPSIAQLTLGFRESVAVDVDVNTLSGQTVWFPFSWEPGCSTASGDLVEEFTFAV